MISTLNLVAEVKDGKPILEEVLVESIGTNRFRLSRSPGLIQGLAAGDEFELADDEMHGYRLLRRGGNVSVQLFFPHDGERYRELLVPLAEQFGGRLDGCTFGLSSSMLVFTFPIKAGFPAIENVMARAKSLSPGCEWYYGNIYDTRDGVTPLNWWLQA